MNSKKSFDYMSLIKFLFYFILYAVYIYIFLFILLKYIRTVIKTNVVPLKMQLSLNLVEESTYFLQWGRGLGKHEGQVQEPSVVLMSPYCPVENEFIDNVLHSWHKFSKPFTFS